MICSSKKFVASLGLSFVLCAAQGAFATPAYEYTPYTDAESQMHITDFGPHVSEVLGVCPGEEVHFNLAALDKMDKKRKKRSDGTPYGDWEDASTGGNVFQIQFFVTGGASFGSSSGVPLTFREFLNLGNSPQANNLKMAVNEDWDGGFINASGYVNDNAPPLTHPDSGYRNDPTVSKSWSFAPRIGNAPTEIELVEPKQFGIWYPEAEGDFSYRLGPTGENYTNQTVTEHFSSGGGDFSVPGDLSESWLNAVEIPVVVTRDENGTVISVDDSARRAESQRRRAFTTSAEVMAHIGGGGPLNEGTFTADEYGVIHDSQAGGINSSLLSQAAWERGIKTWFILTFKSCGQEIGKVKVTRRTQLRVLVPEQNVTGRVIEVMVELA